MSKTQFRPKVEIEPYNSKLTIILINGVAYTWLWLGLNIMNILFQINWSSTCFTKALWH